MKNFGYVNDLLQYLYDEGERDLISFSQILGMVSYGEDDEFLGKSNNQRIEDALSVVRFLVDSGDFKCVKHQADAVGKLAEVVFHESAADFEIEIKSRMSIGGIDDFELVTGYWLKKAVGGKHAPMLNAMVCHLFQGS